METPLASNIRLLRKRFNKTQDDVAFGIGLKRPSYTSIELGNSLPSIETLINLSNYFKLAVDTLLKVELTKLSEFQLSELERGNDIYIRGSNIRVLATTVNTKNIDNIELVGEKAKAGYQTGYADTEYINELPRFTLPFLSQNKKYRTFQISGDSMLPIPDGAWVIGEFVQDWHRIDSGKPYIILTLNDGIVFKIADNLIQNTGELRLFSLNPYYRPYEVNILEVKEVWRFVQYFTDEIPDAGLANSMLTMSISKLKEDIDELKQRK